MQPGTTVQPGTKDETVKLERDYGFSFTQLLEHDAHDNNYMVPRERGVRIRDGVENGLDRDNDIQACNFRDKVIFLGAAESQGNVGISMLSRTVLTRTIQTEL